LQYPEKSDENNENQEVFMAVSERKIFPRTGDKETVYLNSAVINPNISVGGYTMYNDFVNDPAQFEKNNVLYHYPINRDRLMVGRFLFHCLWC